MYVVFVWGEQKYETVEKQIKEKNVFHKLRQEGEYSDLERTKEREKKRYLYMVKCVWGDGDETTQKLEWKKWNK